MSNLKLDIKLLNEFAKIPKYANDGDAGADLVACTITAQTFQYIEYGTGISIQIPKGYVGKIYPRSSISNKGLVLCNSTGIIDSGYRGEIKLRFYMNEGCELYSIGDKIGQLIVDPVLSLKFNVVDELVDTVRSMGGFGSSGR